MIVELDKGEQEVAKLIGQLRHNVCRINGVTNARIGSQSDYITDLDGFGAELAVCKKYNVYPELTISVRSGGHDCIIDGWTVDVKQTRYKTGMLLATTKKRLEDADVYVLCIGTMPVYDIVGWAYNWELLREESIMEVAGTVTYCIEQNSLRSMSTF